LEGISFDIFKITNQGTKLVHQYFIV